MAMEAHYKHSFYEFCFYWVGDFVSYVHQVGTFMS